ERRFREALFDVALPAVMLDTDGSILFTNRHLLDLTGWKGQEVYGQDWFALFVPPDERAVERATYLHALEHGSIPPRWRERLLQRSGETREIEWSSAYLRDAAGSIVGMAGLGHDVTGREEARAALESSETRLRTALDTMLDGVTVMSAIRDASGHIVDFRSDYSNLAIANLSLVTANGQAGRTLLQLFPAHRTDGLFDAYVRVVETGVPFESGSVRYIDPDAAGGPLDQILEHRAAKLGDGYVLSVRDVGARIRAEYELRDSERNLAEAQRIAHIGSWERDIASGSLHWSDESYRIFGMEPGTFDGTIEAFLAFVHPEDRARAAPDRVALAEETQAETEYRIVRPDGTVRLVHEIGEVIRDPTGLPVRLVGTTQDITERVVAEEERARLAAAVEQTGDAVWMQDLDNTVTYVNRSFSRTYGYEPDEIVGRHAGLVDSGRHEPHFFADLWASVAAGTTWTGSIVNRRKDGSLFEVEAVVSGIRDVAGRMTGYMQTDRDVTRERALESALEREARERESIESALARIDPAAPPEEIAAAACTEIVRLPNIDSAFVVILEPDGGRILALEGRNDDLLPAGSPIPAATLGHLRDRAAGGPWVEGWGPAPEDDVALEAGTKTGLDSVAYAPFRCTADTIGLVAIVAYDAATAATLVERLPALVTFGSIVGALIGPRVGARHDAAAERATVQRIIDTSAFRPFFQPIVDLRDGAVVGFEALTRFTDGRPPDLAFRTAGTAGLGIELETACLRASIGASLELPPDAYLSLNASPELVVSGSLGSLLAAVDRPIVLEITEHVAIDDYRGLRREFERLGPAVRIAVDDAGAGYASLRHILELAPHFVKIDIGLTRGVDAEPARQALIAGMGYFAVKRKLHLVAEGIETRKELRALQALGVPFGQGYLLGRPRDAASGPWPTRIDLPGLPPR
ncbi:MAG: PAS domain S-box protein, partial [Candidatus Limnocylindrales bacterium]